MRRSRARVRLGRIGAGKGDDGQALVEFALVAPILLLLILGTVDFARAWGAYQVITYAARAGGRMAAVDDPGTTEDDVRQAIRDSLVRGSLDPDLATVGIVGFGGGRGTPTEVQIDYPYSLSFVGSFLDWLTGSEDLVLTTEFVIRNE